MFNYYPYINYNNQKATHILCKAQIVLIQSVQRDNRKFFNYLIKDGERADIVSYNVYGDPTLDWVIYLINNVVDPYKDWPMTDHDFTRYMEKKYNKRAELLTSTLHDYAIAYYYYKGIATDSAEEIAGYNYTITAETYNSLTDKSGWVAKSVWDHEIELNETKRNIILLKDNYISEFKQTFKDLFING